MDSASRLQRPYGTRDKSASAILGVVKHFLADMGVPRTVRIDNGGEYTNSAFVDYCNGFRNRCELTTPYTPQQNGSVESGLWRANAGHAARIEVNSLFLDIHLEQLKGLRVPEGTRLRIYSQFCGHAIGLIAPRRRRAAICFPRMKSSTEASRRCRFCRSASRRTIASPGGGKWIPRRARASS